MKKIVRLTESDLTNIVNRVIKEDNSNFLRKRLNYISRILDEVIAGLKPNDYDAIDYDDYKEEIVWTTLGTMAYEMDYELPKGKKTEEFFSIMETPEFDGKIRKGYSRYKKMRK
jgi:hypothetical protein